MAIFAALTFSLCLFKYYTYGYNCIDLAIFNQVFFNSSQGHWFNFTIHPTSYLGDHFEIFILLLLPFYNLFKSSITLLFIQVCFAALNAIPLYLIAKKYLTPLLTLLVICLYLFNPATWNFVLDEFHIMPLCLFFLLWAFYFYDRGKFWQFCVFGALSLLVREEVALIVFIFGILALIDRKKLKWVLTPIFASSAYFYLALKIIAHFSATKNYKFLIFYGWLGNSFGEIALNFFLKFPSVVIHVFTNPYHLELILGLFLIALFLPLYRPKYLLLALPALAEFILGVNSGYMILQTHYVTLFLPALLIASIFSLTALSRNPKIINFNQDYPLVFPTVAIFSILFLLWQLAPLPAIVQAPWQTDYSQIKLKNDFSRQIPKQAALLTDLDLLPQFSSRRELYYFWYAYQGEQQYNAGPYNLPDNLQYIFLNFDNFSFWYLDHTHDFSKGPGIMNKLLANFTLVKADQNLALWQKNAPSQNLSLYQIYSQAPKISQPKNPALKQDSPIEFLGYDRDDQKTSLYFHCLKTMSQYYFIQIQGHNLPLGYGLVPNTDWQPGQIIKLSYYGFGQFQDFKIIKASGTLYLGNINSYKATITKIEIINNETLN